MVPIILAADGGDVLGFPKALAAFGRKTALQIALENCEGMPPPIVVGSGRLARALKDGSGPTSQAPACNGRLVIHRPGPQGQIGSLLAGLQQVPERAAFMVYAIDYPLLTPAVVRRLLEGFSTRLPRHGIVVPRFRGRAGHPAIFAPEMRAELAVAASARAVIYRDPRRVKFVNVRTASIWEDFDTEAAYRRLLRKYLGQL